MSWDVARAVFPAMSTTIAVTGVGVPECEVERAAALGGQLAEDWERRFSRFRPDSQLARLNAAGGQSLRVDEVFLDLLETARQAVHGSGGRFDPSVLPALEAAGYDRSIEHIRATSTAIARDPQPAAGLAGWDLVRIDRGRGEATLPPGMRIDLGGVAKGAFADHLATELDSWPGGCVDAGGDLRLWGVPPTGERWTIGIEDPFHPETDLLAAEILVSSIGVATSGTYRRRWQAGERMAHHLIDPRSGAPAADVVRSVTAFARDAGTADIAAKALLIAAAEGDFFDAFGAAMAVVTYSDGQTKVLPREYSDACSLSLVTPSHFSP